MITEWMDHRQENNHVTRKMRKNTKLKIGSDTFESINTRTVNKQTGTRSQILPQEQKLNITGTIMTP